MSDHDETAKSPEKDPGEPRKKPGIVARLKKFYEKQPVTFAISVMGGCPHSCSCADVCSPTISI